MRVLLLHPQDSPFEGPWARESWDMVADLAWAGSCTYAEWGRKLNCPVVGLYNLGKEMVDVRDIRDTLRAGRGELIDEEGIDWWELMAPARYAELHEQLLLARLKSEMGPDAEIRATRPHRLVSELEAVVGPAIHTFLTG